MAIHPIRVLSLCSGGGGLDIGFSLAWEWLTGTRPRTVCYLERESFCASTLVAGMEKKALDSAPIWDSVETFDGRPWRGQVDCLIGGFPCQPHSVAGKRQGANDARWIWPDIERIISQVGPKFIFLENVPNILNSGFGRVLGGLAQGGYDAIWDCFSAAQIGASHKRERLFILAHRQGHPGGLHQGQGKQGQAPAQSGGDGQNVGHAPGPRQPAGKSPESGALRDQGGWAQSGGRSGLLGHAPQQFQRKPEHQKRTKSRKRTRVYPRGAGQHLGQPVRGGLADTWGESGHLGQSEPFIFPPGPHDPAWAAASPALEPAVCGMAHGMAHRVDQLRMLGNGVVPLQAAYALCTLWLNAGLR